MPSRSRTQVQRDAEREKRRKHRRLYRRMRRYLIASGLAILGLLIVVALVFPSIPAPQRDAIPSTEGSGIWIEDQGGGHFELGELAPEGYYNSTPPTSGMHAPNWQRCGIFDVPISKEIQVHNLEHGFVLIQYNSQDDAFIEGLTNMVKQLSGWPDYYILAPFPDMEYPIALTAWNVLQYFDSMDSVAIGEFARTYVGRGPEPGAPSCEPGGFMSATP